MMNVQSEVMSELQSLRTQVDSLVAGQQRVLNLLEAQKLSATDG